MENKLKALYYILLGMTGKVVGNYIETLVSLGPRVLLF